MKPTVTFLSLLLFLTAFSGYGQLNAADAPKIMVTGVGTVTAFPNAANITLALKFVKPTLKEAITENKAAAKQVLAVVKGFVADSTKIKVSLIATDKLMLWNQQLKKNVFGGFESGQKIIFTLTDLNAMQDFTEKIMKTRIYEIEKISYFHTQGEDFIKQAQEFAVSDAIATTKRLAKASGTRLGNIVSIQTDSSPSDAGETTDDSYNLHAYNKGMEISGGVSSSGQLLNFTARVTVHTLLE